MNIFLQLKSKDLKLSMDDIIKFSKFEMNTNTNGIINIKFILKNDMPIIDILDKLDNISNLHLSSEMKIQESQLYFSNV